MNIWTELEFQLKNASGLPTLARLRAANLVRGASWPLIARRLLEQSLGLFNLARLQLVAQA